MQPKSEHFYEFGNFRLDLLEKILLRDGISVPLTPKVFDTLEILVENAGHLLKKDELMQRIWQDRFVEEGNLTFNIKMLRKALTDNANEPRFIETIPRRGYRFIAEVRETVPNSDSIVPAPPVNAFRSPNRSHRLIFALVILALFSIGFASWFVRGRLFASVPNARILSEQFHSEKISSSGKVYFASISPDGKLVAVVNETGGKYGVWLRRLETSENLQLVPPTDDFYLGLAFSPDGQTVYFVRKSKAEKALASVYAVSIVGGSPKQIVEGTEGWISLSPNGRQMSFVRCEYKEDNFCSLFVSDVEGSNERKIINRKSPIRIGDNQFSPDGRSIAFANGQSASGGNDFRLNTVDLESGAENEISSHRFFNILSMKWLPDGSGLLLAARENLDEKSSIWQVSTLLGEPVQMTNDAASYSEISLDNAARRMISVQLSNNFQLFFSSDGVTKTITSARGVVFAPDGKIVYAADDNNIWVINHDGGDQHQLTNNPFNDFAPRVSPNGQFIYFASNRTGTNQIWRMNIDGGNQTQITKAEGGSPVFVTPDEKWVYYQSGSQQTLWRVSADGLEENEFFGKRIYSPVFSPNGKYVAYFFRDREKDNRRKIAIMATDEKKIVKIRDFGEDQSHPIKLAWSNDNFTLNYVTNNGTKNLLWSQSIEMDKPQLIADLGDMEIEDFSLAPDGSSYAYTRGEWIHDAVLIDGLK